MCVCVLVIGASGGYWPTSYAVNITLPPAPSSEENQGFSEPDWPPRWEQQDHIPATHLSNSLD